jgi:hypothetical protein
MQMLQHPQPKPTTKMRVAIIGSSGGGTATLGHTDGRLLIHTIRDHLHTCDIALVHVCFVALDNGMGMDYVDAQTDTAVLYTISTDDHSQTKTNTTTTGTNTTSSSTDDDDDDEVLHGLGTARIQTRGRLEHVNRYLVEERLDEKLAALIVDGTVQGLICISCCPELFARTLSAAAAAYRVFPVTGSGGSSLSRLAKAYHVHCRQCGWVGRDYHRHTRHVLHVRPRSILGS